MTRRTGPRPAVATASLEGAACRGVNPAVFYPATAADGHHAKKHEGRAVYQPALDICARCPVRLACLDQALANGERFGVWGGTTPNDRYQIRRRQRGAA